MTSDIMNGHVPDGGDVLAMNPPAQTGGFIDVECLTDIHKYLSQSEKSDDTTLAAWIKQQYLQEPLIETGRLIRDSEGFANLDKAYRRVRHLTGKAVDKWPFFDQNWKKMSSAAVRKAILRADTVTESQATTNGRAHDVPMNGLGGQHNHTSQTSDLRMVSSAKNSDGHQTQEQKSPQQADRTPPNNRATEQNAHRQGLDRSPSSQPDSVLEDGVQIETSGALAFEGNVNSAMSPAEAMRDTGLGKVRGVHGRFVNNKSPSSTTARKGLRTRSIQKPGTKTAMQSESEDENVSSDEGVKAPITISAPHQTVEARSFEAGNDTLLSSKSVNSLFNDTNLQSPMSAILAADAEAVSSSLDRLPPGLTHKKRKSESNIQGRGPKRTRGSRGGLIGRPRKSGTLAEPVSEHGSEGGKTPLQSENSSEVLIATPEYASVATPIPVETPVKTPARRSSRKSAASALESSTPWDPTADVLLGGSGYKQPTNFNSGAKSNGATEALNGNLHYTRTTADREFDQKTEVTTEEIVSIIPPMVKTDTPLSQSPKLDKTPASTKQKKHVSSPEGQDDDDVKFFARITTSAGIRDIPLSGEDLISDVNLVKRYAAWQRAGNPYATFETFKNIAHFTR
ncbi:hypothetical protein C7974DRAFT_385550 [Boeremia exigua]|uniref:uncharacterized protein n=1 Tax=Boeremia exigua TaxID=749465 RepID=UPI001E8D669B|nr:uncharacterized protein C7974DRAFT_385550 [Boeremia exigua]KAH6642503.1 hypothetical protein C7974DRAFT_385550 [Boeremia exigua]